MKIGQPLFLHFLSPFLPFHYHPYQIDVVVERGPNLAVDAEVVGVGAVLDARVGQAVADGQAPEVDGRGSLALAVRVEEPAGHGRDVVPRVALARDVDVLAHQLGARLVQRQ